MQTVGFTRMEDGTAEDYELLTRYEETHRQGMADRVLNELRAQKSAFGGHQIDRLEHSLQTATRAYRDGADEETVVCALLHDIGDNLAPDNHSEFAAALLKPYVSEANHWVIKHHGVFQGYYYFHLIGGDRDARDAYRDHPHYQRTVDFCHRWDQPSFDPDYESLPLEFFEPMVRRLFAREPFQWERTGGQGD